MKKVVSDSTVVHFWANQTQHSATNQRRTFYYDGRTIYSYGSHFPIASHVTNAKGVSAVLITERTYSNTTAGHVSAVRQASRHLNQIYCYRPDCSHESNFNYWLNCAEEQAYKLAKARKPEIYLGAISRIASAVSTYAEFFEIKVPQLLESILNIGNVQQYGQYLDAKVKLLRKQELAKERELKRKHANELAKWLAGENTRLYHHNGQDYLRFNGRTERIETSQAVEIPLRTGKGIYESIKAGTLKVGDKVLDGYTVNAVNGEIKIGCHTFKTDYLLHFGAVLFEEELILS